MDDLSDFELFGNLQKGDEKAFEKLFHQYYAPLCLFACKYLNDEENAKELVQDFFVKVWSRRKSIHVETSVKQYFFQSIKNQCLNLIKHQNIRSRYFQKLKEDHIRNHNPDPYFLEVGLQKKIEQSIALLPEKRREIFKLSREKGLKYREIADQLDISVKTVEAQMGQALKQLSEMLKDYKDYLIGIVIFSSKKHKSV